MRFPNLELWRPDGNFNPDWFIIEMHLEEPELIPKEADIRVDMLTSALPLLRDPKVTFSQLTDDLVFFNIVSPDAIISAHITSQDIILDVHIMEDAEAAVRFCENVDATCCSGTHRVRIMPESESGEFYPLESGYIFGRVIETHKSEYQQISLVEHPIYGKSLMLESELQFGEADEYIFSGSMVNHSISPDTKRVLIIGGGDCGVLREVLKHPVEHVVMVELDKAVLDFSREHFPAVVSDAPEDPRAKLLFADAFEFMANSNEKFDLVISDLSDEPIGDFSLDDQIALMVNVLADNGTLGTHAQHTYFNGDVMSEPIILAISKFFENVEVTKRVVPSYQDQSWLFVSANLKKF